MRVVITGATGNVGTAVVRRLRSSGVDEIVGIARRPPREDDPQWRDVRWQATDITSDDLRPAFQGADAVVHLAWLIQPSHAPEVMARTNVLGSRRVFEAAAAAGVGALVHASSVGVYSPGPAEGSTRPVDESWPRDGIPTSFYSRDKALSEAILDAVEAAHPGLRVVRLRPGLIFQAPAASEIVRYFLGRFVPLRALRPGALPALPLPARISFQAVHADDVAEAYRLAVTRPDARGAYNVAADPIFDPPRLAAAFGARWVEVPAGLARAAAEITWRLHLQPSDPGWLDLGVNAPVMDTSRIRTELGWTPAKTGEEALHELLDGMHAHAGGGTPVLADLPSLPARLLGRDRR